MTAFEPRTPASDGNEPSQIGKISVSMRAETSRGGDADGPVSPWLYIAGALVTLAALYAVNFGLEDSGFAILTYLLAAGGYCSSYFLRVRGISLRGLQVPLLTLLGFFFLLSLLFGQGVGVAESPSRNLQIALTWVAILHAYTLSNNAAVLFGCVPAMTLIALVSTTTTESEAQNAFLVFFCAATFLLVHENYLRTQARTADRSAARRRPKLFVSQFVLATGCFLGAIILAHLTQKPMQFVGERLFPQGTINAIRNTIKQTLPTSLSSNASTTYDLATGPVSATEQPLLEVQCDEPLYWRGGTFDRYTGRSFKNTLSSNRLDSVSQRQGLEDQYMKGHVDPNVESRVHFEIMQDTLDLPESEMVDHRLVKQHVKVLSINTSQIYGASRIKELDSIAHNITTDNVGALNLTVPFPANTEYDVVSVVPSFDEKVLRAAPADDIPADIKLTYLQRNTTFGPENPVLADLAAKWTAGINNNYDKVRALQARIAETCKYNLNTPAAPRDKDVVAYFLTESREGYCDSFGSALTMMCRYAGIPARMALGFLHGEATKENTYLVKDKDRHIWTEVYFPRVGWVTFDATEGAVDITPKGDSAQKQKQNLFGWLAHQGAGPKAIELIVLVLLAYLVKTELIDRLRPGRKQPGMRVVARPATNLAIHNAYNAAVRQLARKGLSRPPSMTAVEFARMVDTGLAQVEIGSALTELTLLHNRFYYDSATAAAQDVTHAQTTLARLTEALRQYKPVTTRTAVTAKSETA